MLERCRQIQLSLNIKKCIFVTPIRILLGHIVCKEGIKVEFAKIKIILDLKPPVNPKQEHFDGEIVIAPRSKLRCNYHMISKLYGAEKNPMSLSFYL